jgi:hypothetical protein
MPFDPAGTLEDSLVQTKGSFKMAFETALVAAAGRHFYLRGF